MNVYPKTKEFSFVWFSLCYLQVEELIKKHKEELLKKRYRFNVGMIMGERILVNPWPVFQFLTTMVINKIIIMIIMIIIIIIIIINCEQFCETFNIIIIPK